MCWALGNQDDRTPTSDPSGATGGICSSWFCGSGKTSVDGQVMTRWPRHARQRECTAKMWRGPTPGELGTWWTSSVSGAKAKAGQWQSLSQKGLVPCEWAVANRDLHFTHLDCTPHLCMLPPFMLLTHILSNKHRSSLALGQEL